jgi:hypothetical protein
MSNSTRPESTVEILQQQVRELQAELRQLKTEPRREICGTSDVPVGRRRMLKKLAGLGIAGTIIGGGILANPVATDAAGEGVMSIRGIIRAPNAGINSTTCAFVHQTIAANITGNYTIIDHPHCNNQPGALLFVTHNFNPSGQGFTYDNNALGVFYKTSEPNLNKWGIYHEDENQPMLAGRYYNVLIIIP